MAASLDIICGMRKKHSNSGVIMLVIICTVFVASIVWGLMLVGSPADALAQKLDEHRLRDIDELHWELESHVASTGSLPETIEEIDTYKRFLDPRTGEPYTYKQVHTLEYEVCVTYETVTTGNSDAYSRVPKGDYIDSAHEIGEVCYTRVILNTEDRGNIIIR